MDTLGKIWCSVVHDAPMWPIHGRYACRVCGREYPVEWLEEHAGKRREGGEPRLYQQIAAESPGR